MSYIRSGWPMKYVKGRRDDYVFMDYRGFVEDYGNITDDGFVELLFMHWKTDDDVFKDHLLKRLAERLNVDIRKKPLSRDDIDEIMEKRSQISRK